MANAALRERKKTHLSRKGRVRSVSWFHPNSILHCVLERAKPPFPAIARSFIGHPITRMGRCCLLSSHRLQLLGLQLRPLEFNTTAAKG
ncbi:hypothetical protein [Paenibacillus alvei]|uniref:hypothetical protein n=1 Tax=Paenibacillus alvei TaxID=44250 RepID=UPI0013DCD7DB|nr:hypothetical protein [Paenibacillus alvei]